MHWSAAMSAFIASRNAKSSPVASGGGPLVEAQTFTPTFHGAPSESGPPWPSGNASATCSASASAVYAVMSTIAAPDIV
jgi:hypothetical protein